MRDFLDNNVPRIETGTSSSGHFLDIFNLMVEQDLIVELENPRAVVPTILNVPNHLDQHSMCHLIRYFNASRKCKSWLSREEMPLLVNQYVGREYLI